MSEFSHIHFKKMTVSPETFIFFKSKLIPYNYISPPIHFKLKSLYFTHITIFCLFSIYVLMDVST